MIAATLILLSSAIPFTNDANIRGEIVRLGDVADLSALPAPLHARARELPLARFDASAAQASVPHAFLAAQARAKMPVLGPWLAVDAPGMVRLHRPLRAGSPEVAANGAEGVRRGETVSLDVAIGAFHITRSAIAMTDAKPGERLFVRTVEGEAVTAWCVEKKP